MQVNLLHIHWYLHTVRLHCTCSLQGTGIHMNQSYSCNILDPCTVHRSTRLYQSTNLSNPFRKSFQISLQSSWKVSTSRFSKSNISVQLIENISSEFNFFKTIFSIWFHSFWKPSLHIQIKEPRLFMQTSFSTQGSSAHSFISTQVDPVPFWYPDSQPQLYDPTKDFKSKSGHIRSHEVIKRLFKYLY